MRVAIGIPTYNRRHLIELHASSLRSSFLPPGTKVIVIDDASTEYDIAYLTSIYPDVCEIRRRSENSGGASFAQRAMMEQLLATDADAVMLLDSDLIVRQDFLTVGIDLLRDTDGVLSLFNTPNHPDIGVRGPFLIKEAIGCAGSLWRRGVAQTMLENVASGPAFDWRFSEYLNGENIAICVARHSLVQHIGFSQGQSHTFESGDFGVGFGEADAHNAYRGIELLMSDSQAKARHTQSQINAIIDQSAALEKRLERIERLLGIGLLRRAAGFVRRRK